MKAFGGKSERLAGVPGARHRRYDIDKNEIGSGGYGKVFIGRDRNMRDRLVAIKKAK